MSNQTTADVLPLEQGYDYALLDRTTAAVVRAAAGRINDRIKKSLADIVAMGNDLLEVERSLPRGEFGPWLRAEFAWTKRTAEKMMSAAAWLSASCEIISQLRIMPIMPTAAYNLAAPSTPEAARQEALERARAGERITPKVAQKIIERARSEERCDGETLPAYRLRPRLAVILDHYEKSWQESEHSELVEQVREFADKVELRMAKSQSEQRQDMA